MPLPVQRRLEETPHVQDFMVMNVGYYTDTSGVITHRVKGLEHHTLILVEEGSGWVQFGTRTWDVPTDHLLWVPAHVPHRYALHEEDPWKIYWMSFTGAGAEALLKMSPFDPDAPVIPCVSRNKIFRQFQSAYATLDSPYTLASHMERARLLINILSLLHTEKGRASWNPTQERIEAVMEYMNENIDRPEPVEVYAKKAGYSVAYFREAFRAHCGVTPKSYFAGLQLRQASELLEFSTLQIAEIASRVGFSDPLYFSRFFKKHTGVSPKVYRQQNKTA